VKATPRYCPDCGSSHLQAPCGMTFRERLRTVSIDPRATPVKTEMRSQGGRYYDSDAVSRVFGEDSREELLEHTDGLGAAQTGADGNIYHRDRHTGEVQRVSDKTLDDIYLGGNTEA
jgi:hypothetical protein